MISAQENAKLQRANFEAEQEEQRKREYELMGRQLGKMDLVSNATSRYSRRSTNDREDEVDVLGLAQDIDESDMAIQESDDW
jgi:Uma2 family endonuclease